MPPIPDTLAEARQLLAACGWQVEPQINMTKTEYIVIDREGVRRRSFIPLQRLLDYARGVFDSTDFELNGEPLDRTYPMMYYRSYHEPHR